MDANPISGPAAPALRRHWPVRLILVGIVFALVLPGMTFCGVLLVRFAASERSRGVSEALSAAVSTADSVDREINGMIATLRALATSPALAGQDLTAFAAQLRAVAEMNGQAITLADVAGQQLVNTRLPPDAPLPRIPPNPWREEAIATGLPTVSQLFRPEGGPRELLTVLLPIRRGAQTAMVLSIFVDPMYLSSLLQAQGVPSDWVVSIIDGNERIVARSAAHEQFIGRTASADLRQNAGSAQGTWTGASPNGTEVVAAYTRTRLAPWRVVVAVPVRVIEAPMRGTLSLLVVAGTGILALCSALAWQLGRLITTPLRLLVKASRELGQGRSFSPVRSSIAEVDEVSRALLQAKADLQARVEALAAERAQLLAVVETVPAGLLIADKATGQIVSVNHQVERMLGYPARRSAVGERVADWSALHQDGRPVAVVEMPLTRALGGEDHPDLQCRMRREDGSLLWVQCQAAPIRTAEGEITGAVVAILDVDEVVQAREEKTRSAERLEEQVARRTGQLREANQRLRDEIAARAKAEEQLRQAQKMEAVGRLTGGIAHDFNNLLTIVVGSLDLLRRRVQEERSHRLLENAMEGAARAATLTARLLAFSRQQPLSPQAVEVNRLVAGMSDLLHRTLGEGVRVETVLAGGVWQTHADPNQLENALLNLAVNARDAMAGGDAPGGTLTIETANARLDDAYARERVEVKAGEYVMIAVSDTGTGMSPELVEQVFEPFFTTKPLGQGTGLGLSQVHGFVKQSGGHVVIYTEPGHGTSVKIYLPRFSAEPEVDAAAAVPAPDAVSGARGETVLVVEDEQGVRRFSTEAMRELGYTVLEAADAAAALRVLDAHPEVSLLFTDVILPDLNGRKLAEAAVGRRPGLPVLFTTGYASNAAVHSGHLEPGVDLIGKPFTLAALSAKLREVLDRPR